MKHWCSKIRSTRDGAKSDCLICAGMASDSEIARAYRSARLPAQSAVRPFKDGFLFDAYGVRPESQHIMDGIELQLCKEGEPPPRNAQELRALEKRLDVERNKVSGTSRWT